MAQARLDVKVTGDASGALRAINAVRAAGDEFANKFREQSKEAVGQIVHMINPVILLSTAIVAGVAKGVDAIRKHFEQGREMARKANEDLQKNAKDLGVTADAYQAVRTQAQMAGKSVDEFNAAMKSVKEGKATIDEVAASFRMIGSGAQAAREAAKQIALEVAGERMAREKAAEEAEKNRSAVTRADRLEAWGRARIAQGASMDEVRNGIIDSDRSAWAWQRLSYRERQEMFARLEAYHTQNSPEAVATRAQAAQAAREQAASEAAWAQAEQEARARVQAINAAGGVLNWAVGQVSAQAGGLVGADDSRVQELVSRYSRWYERSRLALSGNPAAEYAKQFADATKAQADAAEAKRKAEEKTKADKDKADAAAEAKQRRIADVKEWAKSAFAEAQNVYSGGYANGFGLMAGGGDLIGSGRYRAVTRMTEAQKLLQVQEASARVLEQMNEKLNALQEG